MIFNSLEFAIFFVIVTILFFTFPHKYRWALLLSASCFFYMFFKPIYILILFFTIVIDYIAGIYIEKTEEKHKKKLLLLASLVANIGILMVFKYYNFIAINLNHLFEVSNVNNKIPLLEILLPIGLSFHTFQAMSYTIEVYRGNQKAEKHFGIYSLYVMFYPQLVAGPIERPQNVLHQFHEVKTFDYQNMKEGLIQITWGLIKKVVIADRLSMFVNEVYGDVHSFTGIPLIIAIIFFSFQIFCDFSGYSDIALGTAKCMGYHLMTNFNKPYMAISLAEFWKRWHISLSTWFRDYLYIPLGGNRVKSIINYRNILIVFVLSGLWHGANWTFIIWGLFHGVYLIVESIIKKTFNKRNTEKGFIYKVVNRVYVFFLVSFAWIFFRAQDFTTAIYIIKNAFRDIKNQLHLIIENKHIIRSKLLYLHQGGPDFFIAIISIAILIIIHYRMGHRTFFELVNTKNKVVRWSIYYVMIIVFVMLGVFNKSEFIYFQF